MPIVSHTLRTSAQSLSLVQTPFLSFSSQFFMNTPMTSCPARFSSSAATDESTPPDMPTTIFAMTLLLRLTKHLPAWQAVRQSFQASLP